jgi:hypothetical protein
MGPRRFRRGCQAAPPRKTRTSTLQWGRDVFVADAAIENELATESFFSQRFVHPFAALRLGYLKSAGKWARPQRTGVERPCRGDAPPERSKPLNDETVPFGGDYLRPKYLHGWNPRLAVRHCAQVEHDHAIMKMIDERLDASSEPHAVLSSQEARKDAVLQGPAKRLRELMHLA